MALNFFLKRTATASKRPVAASVSLGEINIDYDTNTFGLFAKNSAGTITKIGPVEVGTAAPNATPAGSAGNSRGEQWLDTTNGILKTYNGTAFVNPVPNGSTTVVGILQLTDSISSTSTTTAATPNSVKNAYDAAVPKACYTALGALTAGTGVSTVGTLALGTNGQFLAANSGCSTGVQWCTLSIACVPCSAFTASGQLLAGTGTSTFTALNVGSNNQILAADSACTGGLKWLTSLCGYTDTAGLRNTALGFTAGDSVTSGTDNTSIGFNTGTSITTGLNNTLVGSCAGDSLTTGTNNIAIGTQAMAGATTATNNLALGFAALGYGTIAGGGNIGIGIGAGANLSSGFNNTLIAQNSGDALTTGSNNVAVGYNSLTTAITTSGSVAIGNNALQLATTGANNTAVGFNAGAALTTGGDNTMLGNAAGDTVTTGLQNTFVGSQSGGLAATNSDGNTALGYSALGQGVLSGAYNIGIGNSAGINLSSGALNTLVGYSAGSAITTGNFNTLIGRYAGTAALSNNVVLSDGSANIKLQINQNGAIGVGTAPSFGTASQILQSNGTGAANTWVDQVWLPLTTQTLTTTTATTILTLPIASFRGTTVNISVSDATGANFYNDSWMIIHNGTTTNTQLAAPGGHLGSAPYTLTSVISGANLFIQVTSASTNSTKYVGAYQTFAI